VERESGGHWCHQSGEKKTEVRVLRIDFQLAVGFLFAQQTNHCYRFAWRFHQIVLLDKDNNNNN
jgi:hypothetical protein